MWTLWETTTPGTAQAARPISGSRSARQPATNGERGSALPSEPIGRQLAWTACSTAGECCCCTLTASFSLLPPPSSHRPAGKSRRRRPSALVAMATKQASGGAHPCRCTRSGGRATAWAARTTRSRARGRASGAAKHRCRLIQKRWRGGRGRRRSACASGGRRYAAWCAPVLWCAAAAGASQCAAPLRDCQPLALLSCSELTLARHLPFHPLQQGAPPETEPWFCPVCKYPDRGRPLFQCGGCKDSFHFECAGTNGEVGGLVGCLDG